MLNRRLKAVSINIHSLPLIASDCPMILRETVHPYAAAIFTPQNH